MAVPVSMTDAIPLLDADGSTGRNSARDIRIGLLGAVFAHGPQGSQSWREGVLPTGWSPSTGFRDLRVASGSDPTNRTVTVAAGAAVIVRVSHGPYLCYSDESVSVTLDPADPVNPRVDLVVARLYDTAIGDATSGPHGPQLDVLTGVPAPSDPQPQPAPEGAVALAEVTRPAGVDAITQAQIRDRRTGAGLHGTPRVLLGGDTLDSPGTYPGELRIRAVASNAAPMLEVWTGSAWRTHGVTVVATTADVVAPYPDQIVYEMSTRSFKTFISGAWLDTRSVVPKGKRWRTTGFLTLPAAPTPIPLAGNRVQGGVGVVPDGLVVPVDGVYKLELSGFAAVSSGWQAEFAMLRSRSGVADRNVVYMSFWKATGGDFTGYQANEVPLKAGDTLKVIGKSTPAGGNAWGQSEGDGTYMVVTYVSPLPAGVTPF